MVIHPVRKVREDTRAFFRMLRLNEQCLRKDFSKDQADDPPPLDLPNYKQH